MTRSALTSASDAALAAGELSAASPWHRHLHNRLASPRGALRHWGPNWFASVMGTGILANAAILLPAHIPGLHALALGAWMLAAALLLLLVLASVAHWLLFPDNAREHHRNPAMAPFYGAPPMAFLTVGAGTLLVGRDLVGLPAAVRLDEALWLLGTLGGLASAVAIPYLMFTAHPLTVKDTYASWLMPVVPPMVSAATGAALLAHLPAGQDRLTLLLACCAMFGLSLLASLIIITLLWGRLAWHGPGSATFIPTLWIVLGPLGQSITATGLLANACSSVIPFPPSSETRVLAVIYGMPVWGFAMLWLGIAAAITMRTARQHLPFSLSWWSFTFPVGTLVTGTSTLAQHTRATCLVAASVALYALLIIAWATAATRTTHGALSGQLFDGAVPPVAGRQAAPDATAPAQAGVIDSILSTASSTGSR